MHNNIKPGFLGVLKNRYWGTDTPDAVVSPMKAALLTYGNENAYRPTPETEFSLKVGFTQLDLDAFLDSMFAAYPYSYMRDYRGTIWLEDGTWFSRDFDLSEVDWEHWETPVIPDELLPAFNKYPSLTDFPVVSDDEKGTLGWDRFMEGVIENNRKFFEQNGNR